MFHAARKRRQRLDLYHHRARRGTRSRVPRLAQQCAGFPEFCPGSRWMIMAAEYSLQLRCSGESRPTRRTLIGELSLRTGTFPSARAFCVAFGPSSEALCAAASAARARRSFAAAFSASLARWRRSSTLVPSLDARSYNLSEETDMGAQFNTSLLGTFYELGRIL